MTTTTKSTQTTQGPRMIGIPGSYFFKMCQQDYRDYRQALAREFLQNSADAGASQVEFKLDQENRTLEVLDDGCGMSREVLEEKLLVLGGTQKLEGSVGGFGKAKELLFFAWESYQIHTHDLLVEGQGATYTIEDAPSYVNGTHIKVTFPEGVPLANLEWQMRNQLESNQLERCQIIFNGETLDHLRRGKLVREIEYEGKPFAHVHLNKSQEDDRVYVRLRGVTMFVKWLGIEKRKGRIVIELQGESVDLLTSNRDGMNYWAERELDKIIQELLVNCNSALREKPLKVDHYEGEGLLSTCGTVKRQHLDICRAVESTEEHVEAVCTVQELVDIVNGNQRLKYFFKDQAEKYTSIAADRSLADAKAVVRTALHAMTYKPDFYVKRRDKLPKALNPESWTTTNLKLALMWEAAVKRVLLDSEKEVKFAIGWTTDAEEAMAELFPLENGSRAFLLNPHNPAFKMKNFTYLVGELVDLAIHEVTHMDHKSHDERFVLASEEIRRRCRATDFGGIIKEAIKAL